MKKIIFGSPLDTTIAFKDINPFTPIFVKKLDKFVGMVVNEASIGAPDNWIIRTGGNTGATGFYPTLLDCLQSGIKYDYTYHIEG